MRHRHRLERQQAREANKQQLQFEIEEIKKTIDKGGLSEVEYEAKMKELKEREEALGEIATEERKEGLDIDKFVTSEKESKIGFGTEDSELERQISGLDYSEKSSSEISVDQMLKSSNESLAIKEEIEAANRAKQQLKKSEEETEAKVDPDIHQLQVYKDYVKRHKKVVRQFYTHKDPVKLKLFLLNHPEVVNDAVMSVALIDMVNYFSEDKESHAKHMVYPVTHLKFILEIQTISKADKKRQIITYFDKFFEGHEKMLESYEEERNSLLQKSRMLADSRLEDIKAQELEERKKYLGGREPLDPNCVINEIPKEMAHCFIQRDTEQLIKVLSEYNPEEASKYMDMCVRSGLWTPNPSDDAEKVEEEVLSEYDKSDVPEGEEPVEKAKSEQKNV
ncbi:MAG: hsp90 co-chaperone Cdc37 [Marteilia pararefringens]